MRGVVRGLTAACAQVRYAACVAARAFMLAAGDGRAEFYPALLPPLCFNRHDVAEGVRGYSLETWRLVLAGEGPAWVARCLPQARPPRSRSSPNECECTGAKEEHSVRAGMGRWHCDVGQGARGAAACGGLALRRARPPGQALVAPTPFLPCALVALAEAHAPERDARPRRR